MSTDDKTSTLPWLQICLQCIDRAAKCERLCFRTQLMARAGHSLNVRGETEVQTGGTMHVTSIFTCSRFQRQAFSRFLPAAIFAFKTSK
jgi:hypothetical protein